MNCEMCGTEGELVKAVIENTELNVCKNCSSFGKVMGKAKAPEQAKGHISHPNQAIKEKTVSITANYGEIIRKKREQLGMNQKDFAKKLSEKESIIHKIEVESIEPNIELAKKLEKQLGIKLIEETEEDNIKLQKKKRDDITLGDLIKVKKR